MKTNTTLIWPDAVIILHPPRALHTDIAFVILPADAEGNHTIRLRNPAQYLLCVIGFLIFHKIEDIFGNLLHCLDKFGLTRIALFDAFNECIEIDVIGNGHCTPPIGGLIDAARLTFGPRF